MLRWVTHRPFRVRGGRVGTLLFVAGIVIVALLLAGVATGALQQADFSAGEQPDDEIDAAEVEFHFIELLNEERQSRGLGTVEQRDELTAMGTEHAENMAENEYVGHEWPDGTTPQDRFEKRHLLRQCRYEIPATGGFYPGAENANGVYLQNYVTSYGSQYDEIANEQTLSKILFKEWMASPGHRTPMMLGGLETVGLGLSESDGKMYAALEMCGD